jgi:hypothetical protein
LEESFEQNLPVTTIATYHFHLTGDGKEESRRENPEEGEELQNMNDVKD